MKHRCKQLKPQTWLYKNKSVKKCVNCLFQALNMAIQNNKISHPNTDLGVALMHNSWSCDDAMFFVFLGPSLAGVFWLFSMNNRTGLLSYHFTTHSFPSALVTVAEEPLPCCEESGHSILFYPDALFQTNA